MKILIVGGDDALLSSLAEELQSRDFEVLLTHFGDGGLCLNGGRDKSCPRSRTTTFVGSPLLADFAKGSG
jgi:hypothetical protein